MPVNVDLVGQSSSPFVHDVDARWIMAYSAALGDRWPACLDTAAGTVIAHPLFPVCLEWPAILDIRNLPGPNTVTREEAARGVHAAHDLHLLRPIRAGDRLTTTLHLVGTEAKRPGAVQHYRLDTVDAEGELVARTWQVSISRGVATTGPDRHTERAPAPPDLPPPLATPEVARVPVTAGAAHVYTECARIWNPIHTDRAVALAAGLPDLILHGTATLALAVSSVVDRELGGDPARVRRVGGQFRAMVLMPGTIEVVITHRGPDRVGFEVRNDAGEPAVSAGFLVW